MAHDQIPSMVTMGAWAVTLLILAFVFAWLAGVRRLSGRIAFVVGFLLLGFAPPAIQTLRGSHWVDLFLPETAKQGGTELVFEIPDRANGSPSNDDVIEQVVEIATNRLDPAHLGISGSVTRFGTNRIAVFLPGADAAAEERARRMLVQSGSLEFAIVANNHDHAPMIQAAQELSESELVVEGQIVARWLPIAPIRDAAGRETQNDEFVSVPENGIRPWPGKPAEFREILVLNEPDESRRITGKYLRRVNPTRNANGNPAVGFHLNQAGGYLLQDLTARNKPAKDGFRRQLAVILNGEVVIAPTINQPIGENGIIESSRFTDESVADLADILNAGAMPVPLKPEPVSIARAATAPDYHVAHSRRGHQELAALYAAVLGTAALIAGCLLWTLVRLTGAGRKAAGSTGKIES